MTKYVLCILQNGHVGFMLSCYDAELSYDSRTDTFQARQVNDIASPGACLSD